MLAPVASQPSSACGSYMTLNNPSAPPCAGAGELDFAAGNGTTTEVTITNHGEGNVFLNVGFNPQAGQDAAYFGVCPMYIKNPGGSPVVAEWFTTNASSGSSVVFIMLYPAKDTGLFNPPPEPDQFLMGTVTIAFYANDGATLDHLTASAVILTSGSDNGDLPLRAEVPFVRESAASATPPPMPISATSSPENTVLTVTNISATPQAVLVSLLDSSGATRTFTTPVLGPNALYDGTLAEVFPDVSPSPGEKLTLTFEGFSGGLIIPDILQASVASLHYHIGIGDPRRGVH
jgi:hypothetical protein